MCTSILKDRGQIYLLASGCLLKASDMETRKMWVKEGLNTKVGWDADTLFKEVFWSRVETLAIDVV